MPLRRRAPSNCGEATYGPRCTAFRSPPNRAQPGHTTGHELEMVARGKITAGLCAERKLGESFLPKSFCAVATSKWSKGASSRGALLAKPNSPCARSQVRLYSVRPSSVWPPTPAVKNCAQLEDSLPAAACTCASACPRSGRSADGTSKNVACRLCATTKVREAWQIGTQAGAKAGWVV